MSLAAPQLTTTEPQPPTPVQPLLQVDNVRRSFGGLVAVDAVSFQVAEGQIKSVIGPNGAGKTTLFNLICGLIRPESGRVLFKQQLISGWKPFQVARAGMSRTFQNPNLFLQMNVLENVMVGCHNRTHHDFLGCGFRLPGQRKEELAIRRTALEKLAFVGLEALAGTSAGSLAFGERRMVELARALCTGPEILLLDEPASGLNTREKEDLGELIRKIRDTGVTILLVEHDMSLVMSLSDEILVLHHGRRIAEGPATRVQNDPQVISVYLGQDLDHAAAS